MERATRRQLEMIDQRHDARHDVIDRHQVQGGGGIGGHPFHPAIGKCLQ